LSLYSLAFKFELNIFKNGKTKDTQQFRSPWLKDELFKDWLHAVKDDSTKAFRKVYCTTIRAKRSDLVNHSASQKHKSAVGAIKIHHRDSITFKPISLKTNRAEAALALFVSNHCAIFPIDHLSALCNNNFSEGNIKLHRTKCSKLLQMF